MKTKKIWTLFSTCTAVSWKRHKLHGSWVKSEDSARWRAEYRHHGEELSGHSQGDCTLSFCILSSCFWWPTLGHFSFCFYLLLVFFLWKWESPRVWIPVSRAIGDSRDPNQDHLNSQTQNWVYFIYLKWILTSHRKYVRFHHSLSLAPSLSGTCIGLIWIALLLLLLHS